MSLRFLIIIFAMVATVLAVGFFLAWPKYQQIQQLKEEISMKEEELNSKTDYYSQIKKINSRLEEYQDSLSQVEQAISKSYSLPATFDYLQKVSGESGLILEDLSLESLNAQGILKEINLNLRVSGAYSSFKNFLSALENSARLFNIKNISFSSSEKTGQPFSFNLTIATYSY